jgi:DNA primase large subunit
MLTIKDYAKYPFLKGAANILKSVPDLQKPIITIIDTDFGKKSIELTKSRLSNALYHTKFPTNGFPEHEIASFFFARVMVSSAIPVNKSLIEKFVTYETNKFFNYYNKEQFLKKQDIENDLQIKLTKTLFTISEYIPIAMKLIQSSSRWKLVNMPVQKGVVDISSLSQIKGEKAIDSPEELFFKEQIKYKIRSTLPMKLDKETRMALDPITKELFGQYYTSIDNSMSYGEVTASNFPPCIQHIIDMIQRKENPTHMGRFSMVSFLNEIGMSETEIASIFQTVFDFDLSQTMYQIEHITGKQGTPAYKCPACDTMLTNGLCIGKENALCKKVKHPLGYYQAKHKFALKQAPKEKK